MFPPENNEGNIEYKRHLASQELKSTEDNFSERFHQLITQLKYRISEGNGTAIYYIGINDDGTIFDITREQKTTSLGNLKKMVLFLNLEISKILFFENYTKILIKEKNYFSNLPEKRILLLGDTNTGKTTFLAYLIKNKLDTANCKAKLFILNHKHEIETGKTSSLNYQQIVYNGIKYVFIDTPGDDICYHKNIKTRNKILLSFNFDLIIFMNKSESEWKKRPLYVYFASYLKIPYLDVELFDKNSEINLINPKPQSLILNTINLNFRDEKNTNMLELSNRDCLFNLLQTYPHHDLGWIMSGYLKEGSLKVGQELFWFETNKELVTINSIYVNNESVNYAEAPLTLTITLKKIDQVNNKPKNGFLTGSNYSQIYVIRLVWIYFSDLFLPEEKDISIFVNNKVISLKKMNKNYKLVIPTFGYNIINEFFIFEKDDVFGFGKIFKPF